MASGHLEKRSAKSWTIVIDLGRVGGKRKRIKRAFAGNKRDAEKELARLITEYEKGTVVEPTKLTFGEFLKTWLADYGAARLSATAQNRYRQIIELRVIPKLGDIMLTKLRPMHLQRFYRELMEEGRLDQPGKPLSQASLTYHHAVLHKALDSAVKQQLIPYNPADAVEPPKLHQREVRVTDVADEEDDFEEKVQVLDEGQVAIMLEAARATPYYPLLFVAVWTGMRRGELLGLRWQDIDFDAGTIRVRQTLGAVPGQPLFFKPPKTKKSRRTIEVNEDVLNVLRRHKEEQAKNKLMLGQNYDDKDLVFCQENGQPMHPDTISSWFPAFLADIGLPRLKFHALRHTHASLLLKAGVEIKTISERLGHSSVGITYDIYSHLMPGMQREAVEALEKLLGQVPLEERIRSFLDAKKKEGLSESAYKEYEQELMVFGMTIQKPTDRITLADVKTYLSQHPDKTPSSLQKRLSILQDFLGWLMTEEIIGHQLGTKTPVGNTSEET